MNKGLFLNTILGIIISLITVFSLISVSYAKSYNVGYKQTGISSYYAKRFHNRTTANGERYNHFAMTAAHRYLPFGTRVLVTDKATGKSVTVRINDRGPYHGSRIIDLSGKAAKRLGLMKKGVCKIELKILSLPKSKLPYKKVNPKLETDNIYELIMADFDDGIMR